MQETHFRGKIALKALIVNGEKILISRDANDPDIWEIPGGRLNEREGLEDGLRREIFEELGVAARVNRLVYSEQYCQTRDGTLSLLLAYEVFLENPDAPFNLDPREVGETKWIGRDDLEKQKIYGNCFNALKTYWASRSFCE